MWKYLACCCFLFQMKIIKYSVQCHVFTPKINILSTLLNSPNLCKNISLQCYLVTTVIDTQSLRSQVCVYIRSVFCCSFFTAVISTHINIHITHFHLYRSVNIYRNWFQEQFCNLSWYILYTPKAQ